MSKGTTMKEAIAKWEAANNAKAADATVVKLCGYNPPIEKMDSALSQLVNCEKLSLSSNNIEKIAFLTNLRNLKVRYDLRHVSICMACAASTTTTTTTTTTAAAAAAAAAATTTTTKNAAQGRRLHPLKD